MVSEEVGRRTAPVRSGQIIEISVEGLGHDGEGVGRVDGFALFIPGAIPGDRVRARVSLAKKSYGRAEVLQVLKPSSDRIMSPCRVSNECGGCALPHMRYDAQLRWKRQQVVDALERIGGLGGVTVHPTIGMDPSSGYRNKGQYPVGSEAPGGPLITGFFARGSHRIVPCDNCMIQHPLSNRIVAEARRLADGSGLTSYNENTGEGFLRHILVKLGFSTGEAMCVLVTNGDDPAWDGADFGRRLNKAVPEVVSVVQNINTARTNVILGETTRMLWGKEAIDEILGGLRFRISAKSFFQVNPVQAEVLYSRAIEYVALQENETALDLYCGIGTITLMLGKRCRFVYGVEYVGDAVADARVNAGLNGVANVEFRAGDAAQVMKNLAGEGIRLDVAVMDPPRAGCDAAVLRTLAGLIVPRLVYVSCNPSSLARDLKLLGELGYRTVEVQPVDMFPHTSHVEAVALMTRG